MEFDKFFERKMFYRLEGKNVINCDFHQWYTQDKQKWVLKRNQITPDIEVSTVFLGFSMRWFAEEPVCFETIIFGGKNDCKRFNYSGYDEAVINHDKICAKIIDDF